MACGSFCILDQPSWGEDMIPYKGFTIFGKAMRVLPGSPGWWRSEGSVFTDTPEGSIHFKLLEGAIFESKEAAEAHGLEICKEWVDQNLEASGDV
jgi:hypothetical protein